MDDPEGLMRLTPNEGDDDDTLARVNPKQQQRRWDADETQFPYPLITDLEGVKRQVIV